MKMEISVTAPRAGIVREIRVKETDVVKEGQVLVVLD
jgi:biotin carboxyl carrier protein